MASKLNPGADATLVNAAYRAAMANTPSDYGDTLERAAASYSRTMQASSKMWGNVAKVGASISIDMVANAKEFTNMAALAGGLDSEGAKFLQDEVYSIKDEINALGLFNGTFGDRETKQKKAELKIKQAQLFANIDLAAASVKAGADAVAAGTFDVRLAMEDAEIVNAIIKSNLKNKVTNENNIARLSRNEDTGELMYTMYDVSSNPDGEKTGQTMTLKEFNKSIATNVKDGGAKAQGFNVYNEKVYNRGLKSRTGVYDEQMRAMDSNWIETQLQNPIDLKRALHMKFGYSETSIFDDITKNEGEYSASLYRDLLSITGGKNGLTGDIVDGIVDEGEPGINKVELQNSKNYEILTANLLGLKEPDVTRAYFKDYALKEFEKANNYGHGNKALVAGKTDGAKTDTNPYGFTGKEIRIGPTKGSGSNTYQDRMDIGAATTLIGKIEKGKGFPFGSNNYNYLFDETTGEGAWHEFLPGEAVDKPTETSFIGNAQNLESSIFRTNLPQFQGLETTIDNSKSLSSSGTVVEKEGSGLNPFSVGEIPQDFIDAVGKDDNDVIDYIKNKFNNIKNLTVSKSGNLDTIIIGMGEKGKNRKTKTFTVDPIFADDANRATEIWNWMKNNYSVPLTAAEYAAGKGQ